jgi:alpha-L-fucosidase
MAANVKKASLLDGSTVSFVQTKADVTLKLPQNRLDSIATIVTLSLDKPASQLGQIIPFTTTHSLAYGKKATASSALGAFLHDPSAAFDDNPATHWKMGRRTDVDFESYYGKDVHYQSEAAFNLFQNKGWLEVDLGTNQTVKQLKVSEAVYQKSQIKGFEIQYEKDGQWLTLAQDEKMGNWSKDISPVTAQKFRLVILDSYGFAGVREFQLF